MTASNVNSVDVIIAAHHEQRHIADCLNALLSMNDAGLSASNIIVVINEETDSTLDIVRQFGVRYGVSGRKSAAAARNFGLQMSQSEFVAFVDAHCIVSRNWLTSLTAPFREMAVGACLGGIDYICENALTEPFMHASLYANDRTLARHTIWAETSPLPWVPSGNAAYRRKALAAVGTFDESLAYCEDVDLSWKIFLHGYRLEHVPSARVSHYDASSPMAFLKKFVRYGEGAAHVSQLYFFLDLKRPSIRTVVNKKSVLGNILQLAHNWGYHKETQKLAKQEFVSQNIDRQSIRVSPDLRKTFRYGAQHWRLADRCYYWHPGEERTVLLKLPSLKRTLLEGTAHYIFKMLIEGQPCDIANCLALKYSVDEEQATLDVQEFIGDLRDEGFLEAL